MLVPFATAPTLGWQIAGVIAGIASTRPTVKQRCLHVQYYDHATLRVALQLTNVGPYPATILAVLVSTTEIKDPPIELSPLSISLRTGEREYISVYNAIREYFEKNISIRYKTQTGTKEPIFLVRFKYATPEGELNTDWFYLVGVVSQHMLIGAKPTDRR